MRFRALRRVRTSFPYPAQLLSSVSGCFATAECAARGASRLPLPPAPPCVLRAGASLRSRSPSPPAPPRRWEEGAESYCGWVRLRCTAERCCQCRWQRLAECGGAWPTSRCPSQVRGRSRAALRRSLCTRPRCYCRRCPGSRSRRTRARAQAVVHPLAAAVRTLVRATSRMVDIAAHDCAAVCLELREAAAQEPQRARSSLDGLAPGALYASVLLRSLERPRTLKASVRCVSSE